MKFCMIKRARKVCQGCFRRPALFMRRGERGNKMRWRPDHDLCQRCARAQNARNFAG